MPALLAVQTPFKWKVVSAVLSGPSVMITIAITDVAGTTLTTASNAFDNAKHTMKDVQTWVGETYTTAVMGQVAGLQPYLAFLATTGTLMSI